MCYPPPGQKTIFSERSGKCSGDVSSVTEKPADRRGKGVTSDLFSAGREGSGARISEGAGVGQNVIARINGKG